MYVSVLASLLIYIRSLLCGFYKVPGVKYQLSNNNKDSAKHGRQSQGTVHTYMHRILRHARLAVITVLVCFEPVFKVGLKGAVGRAFSYCTWYVVPDVTALN